MKTKKLIAMIALALTLCMTATTFMACADGEKVSKEGFYAALTSTQEALDEESGNAFTVEMELKISLNGESSSYKIVMATDGSTKFMFECNYPFITEYTPSCYIELKDDKTYIITKNSEDQWKGVISPLNFMKAVSDYSDFIDIEDSFDFDMEFEDLEYKKGRYYVKSEVLENMGQSIGEISFGAFAEMYIAIKDGKLSKMYVKASSSTSVPLKITTTTEATINLKYSEKIKIPSYTVD